MAVLNSIRISQLELGRRLDSECYHKDKWEADRRIRALPHTTLGLLLTDFSAGDNAPQRELAAGLQPFVRTQNVRPVLLSEIGLSATAMPWDHNLKYGDIVAVRVGEGVGDVSVVGTEWNGAAFSDNVLRIKIGRLNPFFVTVYLNTKIGKPIFERFKKGTARSLVSRDNFVNIPIPIFGDKFQEQIEALVIKSYTLFNSSSCKHSEADNLLLTQLNLANWKPQHEATFVRSCSDVLGVHRVDAEYFQPKFQAMFGRLPKEVHLVRLGQLIVPTKGIEVGGGAYVDSGIPFWRVSNLTKHGLEDSSLNFIKDELYQSLREDYEPKQGEFLLSKDATPGLAFFLEQPIKGIMSSGILRLALTSDIEPLYLELVLNSLFVQQQIERDAGGSIIIHWKPAQVCKTMIPRLSDNKEKEIALLVKQSHAARREAKALLEKAKSAVEIAIEQNEAAAMAFLNG